MESLQRICESTAVRLTKHKVRSISAFAPALEVKLRRRDIRKRGTELEISMGVYDDTRYSVGTASLSSAAEAPLDNHVTGITTTIITIIRLPPGYVSGPCRLAPVAPPGASRRDGGNSRAARQPSKPNRGGGRGRAE
eukprot:8644652-Pyramimonas_sp.AAC.1